MSTFNLDASDRFIIADYQRQRPFSNILPGIAGPMGIPMWVFYVNRGQAISSFGVENKDHPIMEFQPANKAYQLTPYLGFRTFVKILGVDSTIYEPFAAGSQNESQEMLVSLNELELREKDLTPGLQVAVRYFTLPEERVAGLVRTLIITNLQEQPVKLEILDGLPIVIPYGVSNTDLKQYNRTMEAFMEVYNQEHNAPFFRLRTAPGDTAEVRPVQAGNFALAISVQGGRSQRLPTFVNPETVFGQNTSLSFPTRFHQQSLSELSQMPQHAHGKTPCAYFGCPTVLPPGESISLYSIYGYASKVEALNGVSAQINSEEYFLEKRNIANELVNQLTTPIETKTSSHVFDTYCRQTFLDNVLRGGWPVHLGRNGKPVTYHIYSRKHGDPERDYNAFFLAAEHYSQGNGNYRDVNQNRRCEVWFDPRVEDTNVRSFMSLIQSDGYNPLVIKGSCFWIPTEKRSPLLALTLQPERMLPILETPFTPGGLLKRIDDEEIELHVAPVDFLLEALYQSEQNFDAEFGEGYWTDHWTYNLDLIDSFLAIYPDRTEALLFYRDNLPFYDSPAFVRPRSQKYILAGNQPRQYESVIHDHEKSALIATRRKYSHLMRSKNGRGNIYRTSLYVKLILLAVKKFATLDPLGMGIEMEADKPAWCDALNGLPGLFGSSLSETFELARLLTFLLKHLPENKDGELNLPMELVELIQTINDSLHSYRTFTPDERDFLYWDAVSTARENYRTKTRLGFDGAESAILFEQVADFLSLYLDKVRAGIDKAIQQNGGLPPTYFTYQAEKFEILCGPDGKPLKDSKQRPYVRVLKFRQIVLPLFLEAAVHMFKTLMGSEPARQLHRRIKDSDLYDRALKMYKTNVSLEGQPMDIGRLRAFTPGWLENESIFLHMEYKYLLELLKAGLYEEFFEDFRHALIAFQDPARYGRNPLENSSFIVSSAHPDTSLHGAGFVARLTGATAEFINMWQMMMVGCNPFFICNGDLCLRFRPALPDWLFDQAGQVSFTFLGHCKVTYNNPARENTYSDTVRIRSMQLFLENEPVEITGDLLGAPYAELVRDGKVGRIDIFIEAL